MAQNKTMAIKHAMAKRYAVQQMTEDANLASCATRVVKQADSVLWNMRHSAYNSYKK